MLSRVFVAAVASCSVAQASSLRGSDWTDVEEVWTTCDVDSREAADKIDQIYADANRKMRRAKRYSRKVIGSTALHSALAAGKKAVHDAHMTAKTVNGFADQAAVALKNMRLRACEEYARDAEDSLDKALRHSDFVQVAQNALEAARHAREAEEEAKKKAEEEANKKAEEEAEKQSLVEDAKDYALVAEKFAGQARDVYQKIIVERLAEKAFEAWRSAEQAAAAAFHAAHMVENLVEKRPFNGAEATQWVRLAQQYMRDAQKHMDSVTKIADSAVKSIEE